MKRIALLLVAAAGLVACGDDDDSTDETTEAVATSAADTAPPAATGAPDTAAAVETTAPTTESVAPDDVMFLSPEGDFSVLFPSEPAESTQQQSLPDGSTVPLDAWQVPLGDEGAYTVGRLTFPDGAVIDAGALLQSAQDQALAAVGATLTSDEAIDLNGIPGRESTGTVSQGGVEGTIVQRMYLAGSTLYQINFAGEGDRSFTDPELAPFFDSFTITG